MAVSPPLKFFERRVTLYGIWHVAYGVRAKFKHMNIDTTGITIDGKTYRNLPEQVAYLSEQINNVLSIMGDVSGIDTTVTQNSGNLITSGAVYSYIQSLDANGVKY